MGEYSHDELGLSESQFKEEQGKIDKDSAYAQARIEKQQKHAKREGLIFSTAADQAKAVSLLANAELYDELRQVRTWAVDPLRKEVGLRLDFSSAGPNNFEKLKKFFESQGINLSEKENYPKDFEEQEALRKTGKIVEMPKKKEDLPPAKAA